MIILVSLDEKRHSLQSSSELHVVGRAVLLLILCKIVMCSLISCPSGGRNSEIVVP